MGMRARGALATIACGGAFALLPAQAALAAPVATTLQATSVTITSAQLTGTVDASSSDTAWGFQYGTTTPYGLDRGPHPIGSGFTFVEQSVTGPTPGTSYHYRLSVIQGAGYTPAVSLGGDVAFTTLSSSSGQTPHSKFAATSLLRRRLNVKHGVASIRFSCTGAAGAKCSGKISLSTRAKLGNRGRTVRCGKGVFTTHQAPLRIAVTLVGT